MLPETTQQLILKLWDLTDRGVIPWKPGETDGEHLFETEGYVVAVSGQPPAVRILRPRGHEVECADAAALSATKWPRPNASRFDEAVRELATRAAEHANGARKTVAAAMSAISTPARAQTPAASSATGKPIFGAIESFEFESVGSTPFLFATAGRAMDSQRAQSFFFEVLPIPGLKLLVGSSAR